MLDLKWIRENPAAFDKALARRGVAPEAQNILELDEARRATITKLQEAQTRRNSASKEIGKAKASRDEARAQALMKEVAELKEVISQGEEEERRLSAELNAKLAGFPNVAPGRRARRRRRERQRRAAQLGDAARIRLRRPGSISNWAKALGLMDFEAAARLSGARFVVLKGALARLERALGAFMLDLHTTEFGYQEVNPPLLVKDDAAFGTAQLPKFADDLFRTTNGYWLIPTAEMPLTNLVRESVVDEARLPLRFTAQTPCFRSEAGAAGKDTRGMVRQHQFSKVEMVSVTTAEQALDEHERMTSCAEEVLKRLGSGLPGDRAVQRRHRVRRAQDVRS